MFLASRITNTEECRSRYSAPPHSGNQAALLIERLISHLGKRCENLTKHRFKSITGGGQPDAELQLIIAYSKCTAGVVVRSARYDNISKIRIITDATMSSDDGRREFVQVFQHIISESEPLAMS